MDAQRGTRFYYHAHAAAERMPGEHGHFHMFAPSPAGTGPTFVHLVGLALDDRGRPLCWFTTNGWVTGEDWLPARRVAGLLAGFQAEVPGRLAPVGRWLSAMVRLHAVDPGGRIGHGRGSDAEQQRGEQGLLEHVGLPGLDGVVSPSTTRPDAGG